MAYDEGLAERVRMEMERYTGCIEKKMFGGIGFLVGGNMACGVHGEDLIVRVGPDEYENALKERHTKEFDLTGRPMKGWIVVKPEGYESSKDLSLWVEQGVRFAQSLPEK